MDRLYQMTVFVAVAEKGTFAGAASKLGMSASTVSRAIAALEREVGVELLRRSTRHVHISSAGLKYLQDARKIIYEVERAEKTAAGASDTEQFEHLQVRAPSMFGRIHLAPMIAEFALRSPTVRIRAFFEGDRNQNHEQEDDIAIRFGDFPECGLRSIQIGKVGKMICAAPSYLRHYGTPKEVSELSQHVLITVPEDHTLSKWEGCRGNEIAPPTLKPQLIFDNVNAAISATLGGGGITQLLLCQARPFVEEQKLTPLFSELDLPELPIYLTFGGNHSTSAIAEGFAALVAKRMRDIQVFN